MTNDEQIHPFRIDIPDADLDDLRQRLRLTRWPEAETSQRRRSWRPSTSISVKETFLSRSSCCLTVSSASNGRSETS